VLQTRLALGFSLAVVLTITIGDAQMQVPSGLGARIAEASQELSDAPVDEAGGHPALVLALKGRWHYGPVFASAVAGDHVYFGTGGAIRVLRIHEDRSWKEVASIAIAGVVRGLFAAEPFLYVADEGGAFRILDISAPEQPKEIGRCAVPKGSRAVTVSGRYAYVAAARSGLSSRGGNSKALETVLLSSSARSIWLP